MSPNSNPKMNMPTQITQTADEYIRLDYIWTDQFNGKMNRVVGSVESGDMDDLIYAVTHEQRPNDQTNIGIITTKEEVVDSEITAYETEIRTAFREHINDDIGMADDVIISAATLGEANTNGHRPVRTSHPAVHYAINTPQYPDKITACELEEHTRKALKKRVDITRAGSGFNMRIREPTITQEEVNGIAGHIISTEDTHHQSVRAVYTAPQSGALPEQLPK